MVNCALNTQAPTWWKHSWSIYLVFIKSLPHTFSKGAIKWAPWSIKFQQVRSSLLNTLILHVKMLYWAERRYLRWQTELMQKMQQHWLKWNVYYDSCKKKKYLMNFLITVWHGVVIRISRKHTSKVPLVDKLANKSVSGLTLTCFTI